LVFQRPPETFVDQEEPSLLSLFCEGEHEIYILDISDREVVESYDVSGPGQLCQDHISKSRKPVEQ
jgi:hypothetical protein